MLLHEERNLLKKCNGWRDLLCLRCISLHILNTISAEKRTQAPVQQTFKLISVISPVHLHDAARESGRLLWQQKSHTLLRMYSMSEVEHAAFPSRYTSTMFAHYEPKRNAQEELAVTELDPSMEEQAWVLLKKCAIVKLQDAETQNWTESWANLAE